MAGYAKVFSDIVDSSIWDEDPATCKVWVTLLALSDQDGYVRGSPGWLAGKSRVTVDQCVSALEKFKLPDARSRTPDFEGRRVEQLPDGWLVLNYIAFRDRLSPDSKAVATRERVRKHRDRYKALRNAPSVTPPHSGSGSVQGSGSVPERGAGGNPVELPAGFPTCIEDAIDHGLTVGCPPEFVEATWNQAFARGGADSRGQPVKSWPHYLASQWKYQQNRRHEQALKGTLNGSPSRPPLPETQLKEIRELIDSHIANPAHSYDRAPTPQEREHFKGLKRKLRELQQQIAGV